MIDIVNSEELENIAFDRLKAKTPADAYPDRPRGFDDLKSILWHMKSHEPVSPLVVIDKDGVRRT